MHKVGMSVCTKWISGFWTISPKPPAGKISLYFSALVHWKHTEHNKTRGRDFCFCPWLWAENDSMKKDKITILVYLKVSEWSFFLNQSKRPYCPNSYVFFLVLLWLQEIKGNKRDKDIEGPEMISWRKFYLQNIHSGNEKKMLDWHDSGNYQFERGYRE